ncbi:MAG TPA: DUF4258 domain-containing protein [Rhizomicrobium sp.]
MRTSETLDKVRALVQAGKILISAHGYDELAADGIFFQDVIDGIGSAEVVEDYPDASKGPSVLILQGVSEDQPIHVVWGIPKGANEPAVLITAYRPDWRRWSGDLKERIPK